MSRTTSRNAKRRVRALLTALALSVALVVSLSGIANAATSPNLVKNGGAESGAGSPNGGVVKVPKWKIATGDTFTAVQYGAPGGFPTNTDPGPPKRGLNFFAGGPGSSFNTQVATQTISLAPYATQIGQGNVTFTLTGWLGGFSSQTDQASVEIDWKAGSTTVASATIGPVTAADRSNLTGLLKRATSGAVPSNATSVLVQLILTRLQGTYNDAYADSLSLKLKGI